MRFSRIILGGSETHIKCRKIASTLWWTPFKWLRPKKGDPTDSYSFDSITLAFEVPIKLEDHQHTVRKYKIKEHAIWPSGRSGSAHQLVWKMISDQKFKLSHLVLDYESMSSNILNILDLTEGGI